MTPRGRLLSPPTATTGRNRSDLPRSSMGIIRRPDQALARARESGLHTPQAIRLRDHGDRTGHAARRQPLEPAQAHQPNHRRVREQAMSITAPLPPQALPMKRGVMQAGDTYNRLTAVASMGKDHNHHPIWMFRCSCGNVVAVIAYSVKAGHSKSCGCLAREKAAERARLRNRKHGGKGTREYATWAAIRSRCVNGPERNVNYGNRGIRVCERWGSFENFNADMGARPSSKHSIERIDVNGDYCPENCKWATPTEQLRNRRDTVYLTHGGKRAPLAQWAEELGINYVTLHARVTRYGWSAERALTTPTRIWPSQSRSE